MRSIPFESTFNDWRRAALAALQEQIRPEDAVWDDAAGRGQTFALFDLAPTVPPLEGAAAASLRNTYRVPAKFLGMGKIVALHSDTGKWALLYRVLWRLTHGEPKLLEIPTDASVIAIHHRMKEVQKDAYRMQQYVRFRETILEDQTWFVAWYEPEHDSVSLNEQFFSDRFSNIRWSILTPRKCMHWDGESVSYSPGVEQSAAPGSDAMESLWVTYYSSIFNPARVKVRAMKAQMPVRNWKNLPEARAIAPLLASAPMRVNQMLQKSELQQVQLTDFALAAPPETNSWTVLRDAAAGCRACPLWRQANCTVFGEGPVDAHVVLVGEQPGDAEDKAGRAFIGPAGQLLDRALDKAGVERAKLYVTNAVKHFKFEPRGKRRIHKNPNRREIASCRPWLIAELELIKPQLIVALGGTATMALFDTPIRVSEERGRILDSPFGPTLITVHPSALLRMTGGADERAAEFNRFVNDLQKIVR